MSRTLRLVTHNAHKVDEIGAILRTAGFTVRGLSDLPPFEVIEDADSFEGNAIKKAMAVHAYVREPALADDSGIVVDALNGAPGIYSARYAGVSGPTADTANRVKLHEALRGLREPRARFVCVLAYVEPGLAPVLFRGELEGIIVPDERGTNGFRLRSDVRAFGEPATNSCGALGVREKCNQSSRHRSRKTAQHDTSLR